MCKRTKGDSKCYLCYEKRIWKMVDGYRQVYDYSIGLVVCVWRNGFTADFRSSDSWSCHYTYRWFIVDKRKQKEGGKIMGAIVASVFVSLVAIIGYIYFYHEDKKTI